LNQQSSCITCVRLLAKCSAIDTLGNLPSGREVAVTGGSEQCKGSWGQVDSHSSGRARARAAGLDDGDFDLGAGIVVLDSDRLATVGRHKGSANSAYHITIIGEVATRRSHTLCVVVGAFAGHLLLVSAGTVDRLAHLDEAEARSTYTLAPPALGKAKASGRTAMTATVKVENCILIDGSMEIGVVLVLVAMNSCVYRVRVG